MSKMTLFEIKAKIRDLLDELIGVEEFNDAAQVEVIRHELETALEQEENKYQAYVHVIRSSETAADAMIEEAERLRNRAKALNNTVKHLKSVLQNVMEHEDTMQLDAGVHTIRLQRNSQPTITIACDVTDLPPDCQRHSVEPNKVAIRELWKRGETPDGVTINVGHHVRIG